jgi:hypothetical protein
MPNFPGGLAKTDCGWRRFWGTVEIEASLDSHGGPLDLTRLALDGSAAACIPVLTARLSFFYW